MNKVCLEGLTIEITERCNMACAHCAKGEAGSADIIFNYIDDLLNQVEAIGMLAIVGGEPLLNLDAISYLYKALCKSGIPLLQFQIITNGSIYTEKFVDIIKSFKKLIDNSCILFLKDGINYVPENNLHRCSVGISLDRFHEQPEICTANYKRYKAELAGYADVRKKMQGNSPFRSGRAKKLNRAWEIDYKFPIEKQQRIELCSADFAPTACKSADEYHLAYPNQRIVCCGLFLDAHGKIYLDHCVTHDRETIYSFPAICTASDPLWENILEYNHGKVSCDECWKLLHKRAEETDNLKSLDQIIDQVFNDGMDEKSFFEKEQARLKTPQSINEAVKNVIDEAHKLTAARKRNAKLLGVDLSTTENPIKAEIKQFVQQLTLDDMSAAIKGKRGLYCYKCNRLVMSAGGEAYCKRTEQGLMCGCGALNLIRW